MEATERRVAWSFAGGRLRSPWSYLAAVLAVGLGLGLRLALLPGDRPVLVAFVLPAALATYLGGLGPGLLSATLAAAAALWLLEPARGFGIASAAGLVHWLLFVATAAVIVWITDLAHRSGRRVERVERRADRLARARRMQRTIRRSEQRLRAMVEDAAVGILEVDAHDRLVAVNGRFCELLGYTREELLGRSIHDLTAPEDRELTRDLGRRARAGDLRVFDYDKRYLRRDGSRVWVHVHISAVLDAAGRFQRAVATVADVTARRAAEASQARLAAIVEGTDDAIVLKDLDGVIRSWNRGAERLFGYTAAEAEGRSIQMLLPPERAGEEDDILSRLRRGERIEHFETERLRKDGAVVSVSVSVSPVRDEHGRLVGASKIARDIGERKRAEAALAAAERRLRSVVEHLPAGLVVADLATGDLHWNAEALRIHGYTGDGQEHLFLESLVAEHELRTLDGVALPVDRWPLPRLLRGEEFRDYALRVRNTRLGWDRVFAYSGAVIPAGDQAPALGLLAMQDVTDRSRAEQAVRDADRRKDEFLGMLSHELRNPLAPIRSSTYVLKRAAAGTPPWTRARDVIERQTEHLARLVDDLLDVTRIARGKILLHRDRVDLRALVARAAEDAQAALERRGLTLRVELPAERLWADADATRITQVIGNLVHNAAKFTGEGGQVTMSLREVEGAAEIAVRDTGAGIDPELLPHLFDAFVQGDRTLARSEGGLGLGLSLVRGLTALHGGSVRASSAGRGRGAEFVVTLPLVAPPRDEHAQAPVARGPAPSRRVLVVDDNADAAESLAGLVELFGHRVEVAFDGPSALEAARRQRPEVVLCDLGLPGMDGYQVARQLRAEQDGGVHLIAVSGYAGAEDQRRAAEAGFEAHLAKPADPEHIERLLAVDGDLPGGHGAGP